MVLVAKRVIMSSYFKLILVNTKIVSVMPNTSSRRCIASYMCRGLLGLANKSSSTK